MCVNAAVANKIRGMYAEAVSLLSNGPTKSKSEAAFEGRHQVHVQSDSLRNHQNLFRECMLGRNMVEAQGIFWYMSWHGSKMVRLRVGGKVAENGGGDVARRGGVACWVVVRRRGAVLSAGVWLKQHGIESSQLRIWERGAERRGLAVKNSR
jgi:hypothetical protein